MKISIVLATAPKKAMTIATNVNAIKYSNLINNWKVTIRLAINK